MRVWISISSNCLKSLIEEEVEISNILESTMFGRKKYDFFRTDIEFKNFKQ